MKLYSAVQGRGLDFRLYRKNDLCPISYSKVCRYTGEKVDWEEIVKGIEREKGELVVLEKEDFEKANLQKTNSIDIMMFCNEASIASRFFERPYFLEPDKKAKKAYALLREALGKSKKVGVARFVLRNHEHLGAIKPDGDVLLFNQMRYQDEIREPNGLELPKSEKVTVKELKMATALISEMTEKFRPEKYKDTYTADLKAVIAAKAKGKKPKAKGKVPTPRVENLMEALKASLEREKV